MDFADPANHWVKLKESELRDKYLDLARELKITMKHEVNDDNDCYWCAQNNPQKIGQGTGRLGNKRTGGHHSDYCII